MAVLQVEECAETLDKLPLCLAIDVEVCFPCGVAVVLEAWEHLLLWLLYPIDETEVVAVIFVPATTESSLEALVVVVVDRCDGAIEVVVHLLLPYEVSLELHVRETILLKVLVHLVLLVVALSLGVVECHVEVQVRIEYLVPDELVVLLMVVVGLVVVVVYVAVSIVILSAGVVAASVKALLVL